MLIDFSTLDDEELIKHLTASLLEYAMKHIWRDEFIHISKVVVKLLQKLLNDGHIDIQHARSLLNNLLYYIIEYNKTVPQPIIEQAIQSIKLELPEELGDVIMNIREQFIAEGMEQANIFAAKNLIKDGI